MFRSYCVRPSGDMVEMSDDLWTITGSPLLTQNTRVIVQCVCNGPLRQYYKNFILYQPSTCGATWRQRAPWNRFKQIVISACSFSSSIDALSYRLVNYNITRKLVCVCVYESIILNSEGCCAHIGSSWFTHLSAADAKNRRRRRRRHWKRIPSLSTIL